MDESKLFFERSTETPPLQRLAESVGFSVEKLNSALIDNEFVRQYAQNGELPGQTLRRVIIESCTEDRDMYQQACLLYEDTAVQTMEELGLQPIERSVAHMLLQADYLLASNQMDLFWDALEMAYDEAHQGYLDAVATQIGAFKP